MSGSLLIADAWCPQRSQAFGAAPRCVPPVYFKTRVFSKEAAEPQNRGLNPAPGNKASPWPELGDQVPRSRRLFPGLQRPRWPRARVGAALRPPQLFPAGDFLPELQLASPASACWGLHSSDKPHNAPKRLRDSGAALNSSIPSRCCDPGPL